MFYNYNNMQADLASHCEELVDKLKNADRSHLSSTKTAEDQFHREVKKLKDKWAVEEKVNKDTIITSYKEQQLLQYNIY